MKMKKIIFLSAILFASIFTAILCGCDHPDGVEDFINYVPPSDEKTN